MNYSLKYHIIKKIKINYIEKERRDYSLKEFVLGMIKIYTEMGSSSEAGYCRFVRARNQAKM